MLAVPAGAATVLSSNWAGYVVSPRAARRMQSVSATWTVPSARCTRGREALSAVWVGLGGYRDGATALEQVGTESDCSGAGAPGYSSWVELLPAASQTLRLKVAPGDLVTGSVTVSGHDVTLRLRDETSGRRYSTTRRQARIDVGTAEWIVEAPASCDGAGSCVTTPLADFGSVAFSNATATAGGRTGTLADARFEPTTLVLRQGRNGGPFASAHGTSPVSATPSAYEEGSFTVTYGTGAASP